MRKLLSESRFGVAKSSIGVKRSGFDLSHGHHTTMDTGLLYPHFFQEVLPGDHFDLTHSLVARMSTPIAPVMDSAYLSTWYFYIPYRLVWDHAKQFFGENDDTAWTQQREYFMPKLSKVFKPGGVADYLSIPTSTPRPLEVNALWLRSYRLVWNKWFRDQNLQDPKYVNKGDSETDVTLDDLLPVARFKDYFTTALPEPQKGPDVLLPLDGIIPVFSNDEKLTDEQLAAYGSYNTTGRQVYAGVYNSLGGALMGYNQDPIGLVGKQQADGADIGADGFVFNNLHADVSQVRATINDLRQAFAVQSLFELDARGGSRYREFIKAHFGVSVPDLTVQDPEFLGGDSVLIGMNQVVQNSATGAGDTPQGNVSGFSKTVSKAHGFTKDFTEPGMVIGVAAIRTLHSYQQGLDATFSRFSRLDYYHPALASIGEMPIYNREIYAYGEDGDEVFGYQEPWAPYRFRQSYVSGAFRSNYPGGSLDFYTYTDDYGSTPRLSDAWIREPKENVERSLAVRDEAAPQFFVDFWFNFKSLRPLPLYGVPAVLGGHE